MVNYSNFALEQPDLSLLMHQMPEIFIVKDLSSCFLMANQTFLKKIGRRHISEIIGQNDDQLDCPAAELAHEFRAQDRDAMTQGETRFINVCYFKESALSILLGTKKQLLDQTNKVVGVMSMEFDASKSLSSGAIAKVLEISQKFLAKEQQQSFRVLPDEQKLGSDVLTPRENECLFFLVRGMTAKEIASAMQISNRTVEKYTATIRQKLNCNSRSALVEKASELGLIYNIPASLLTTL